MISYRRPIIVFSILILFVSFLATKDNSAVTTSAPPKNQNKEPLKLCILMYHGFTQDVKESKYVINIQNFENDIIFLKNNGYKFISMHELINYAEGKANLPEKPVMISIDDGYYNNYLYAYKIAQKHNVKLVIAPIAYYAELYTENPDRNPAYAHMGAEEIKEMHDSGLVEFVNHSYNMHKQTPRKGSSKKENEESSGYIRELYYDTKAAENVLKEFTGEIPQAYVYPFGSVSKESKYLLSCMGYKVTLGCGEGFNYIEKGCGILYNLKRFNRSNVKNIRQIMSEY